MIEEKGLEIGNDGSATHHWARQGQQGESVIDLTPANSPITKWSILADGHHSTGSHHRGIVWEVELHREEEAGHQSVVGWNLSAMTEEDPETAEMLWEKLAKESAHLSAECTPDEVGQQAAWCQEAMGKVLDARAKKIMICMESKRWWNADIRE